MKKITLIYLLKIIILLNLTSCSDDSDNDEQIIKDPIEEKIPEGITRIKGNFDISTLKRTKSEQSNNKSENLKIVAVYTKRFIPDNIIAGFEYKEFEMNADGNFSIDINNDKNFMLFLVNSKLEYKVCGIIGIKTTDNNYWEDIDPKLIKNNIHLGKLEFDATKMLFKSDIDISEVAASSDSKTKINNLSKIDDNINTYANLVANDYKNMATPSYTFSSYIEEENNWGDATKVEYAGYKINVLGTNVDDNLKLYPPSNLIANSNTYNDQIGVEGGGVKINNPDSAPDFWFIEFFFGETRNELPQNAPLNGIWKAKKGEELLGKYILCTTPPINNNNPKDINIPIPLVKITTNNSNEITNLDLKWKYNTGADLSDTDYNLLADKLTMTGYELISRANNDMEQEQHQIDELSKSIKIENKWAFGNVANHKRLDQIVISYRVDCVEYKSMFLVNYK